MPDLLQRKSVLIVGNYLEKFNLSTQLIELNTTARTAQEAANSLGKEVGAIVKSLLFKSTNGTFFLCLVSGDKFVSLDKLARIGKKSFFKASAGEVKRQTGFSIGGVSPVAHMYPPERTLIDKNLDRFDVVYAAAGHPHVVFGIEYPHLVKITKAEEVDIT